MPYLKPVNDLCKEDLVALLDSIDYVFLDIDGVLLHNKTLIPGSKECVEKFRQLGKKIAIVSNNTIYTPKALLQNLNHFEATEDELVTPNAALLAYLKKIGFEKDIYAVCSSFPKKLLREAGYNVIDYKDIHSGDLEENISAMEKLSLKALEVCKNVGAVLVDQDMNVTYGSLQAAKIILNYKDDVLFLTGMLDDTGNINEKMKFLGPYFFIDALERWTKRKSITMAKPGLALKNTLNSKFNILDDSRVLFVGDNVYTDISFGVNCGYQTLLTLSGVTAQSQVNEWKFPENSKPTYISQSLGELYEKIKDL